MVGHRRIRTRPAAQARDILLYKARLIMPEVSQVEIGVRVDDLMGKLCLGRARDTQVRTQRETKLYTPSGGVKTSIWYALPRAFGVGPLKAERCIVGTTLLLVFPCSRRRLSCSLTGFEGLRRKVARFRVVVHNVQKIPLHTAVCEEF